MNTNLCLSTWYKTNKNWSRIIYNSWFSKGLTKKHTTFLWKFIINWTVVKGFYVQSVFSLEKILNPEGTQPHKVKNIFYSLCVSGVTDAAVFMFFLEFSCFGDQKNMSFLDGMTELKMMFLCFSKNVFLQNQGSMVSRISGKNKKKTWKKCSEFRFGPVGFGHLRGANFIDPSF